MKRILFVDDEPMVLQGLQRSLRSMREEWQMEFVESGPVAFERMAQAPYDVVVSDMRMPGMNGAELLNNVMKLYPKTVRLILSGHADRELILQCIGSTHQFLSKPCDSADLKAAVQRATRLEATMQSECIRLLILQIKQLPSVPPLYMELIELLHHVETTSEEVGKLIEHDEAMTGKILEFANMAGTGPRHPIRTLSDATIYLGPDVIRALVLCFGTFAQFEQVQLGNITAESIWWHSRSVAIFARQIAQMETDDRKLIDEAFVAGMLHDLGKLVIAWKLPDEYNEVMRVAEEEQRELHQAEELVLGAGHADAGGYLLGLWGLSVPIVEAIAFHHHPDLGNPTTFTPLTAVHAADALIHQLGVTPSRIVAPGLDLAYLTHIGKADRVEVWRQALQRSCSF